LALSLVALIAPGYVIIKAIWRMLYSMPVMLFLLVLLLWPVFYPLTRNFMRPVRKEDEVLAFSFSLGAIVFFVLVMEAAVALAVLVLHLFVSKQIWSLASRAREKASGKPLPKLFR
jgi:RsiW-degrading membrane proteinase PrsW (M82 family)